MGTEFLLENVEERHWLEDLDGDGIILKWILKKPDRTGWTIFTCLRIETGCVLESRLLPKMRGTSCIKRTFSFCRKSAGASYRDTVMLPHAF
jgi:hypothetical protein